MMFDNIGRRFYSPATGGGTVFPEGNVPFNLQSNKFYADSEEKFLRSVILYSKTQIDADGITQITSLYYDKDCTNPVRPDDLLNMFLKVKIGIIKYGSNGGTIYYPVGIVNVDYDPSGIGLVMPDGHMAAAFFDSTNASETEGE